jgi:hypothetical protein
MGPPTAGNQTKEKEDVKMEEPTDIEVLALRQHILRYEGRLNSECHAKMKFEYGGGKHYMGKLRILHVWEVIFEIQITQDSKCLFFSPAKLTFDQCCQWMMFSREKLEFDYLEFLNGWKPWVK